MAKKKNKRRQIILEHKETGDRIYHTVKNFDNTPDKLKLRKYSPRLQRHVIFEEIKKPKSKKK